jgi:hypothetical protein
LRKNKEDPLRKMGIGKDEKQAIISQTVTKVYEDMEDIDKVEEPEACGMYAKEIIDLVDKMDITFGDKVNVMKQVLLNILFNETEKLFKEVAHERLTEFREEGI